MTYYGVKFKVSVQAIERAHVPEYAVGVGGTGYFRAYLSKDQANADAQSLADALDMSQIKHGDYRALLTAANAWFKAHYAGVPRDYGTTMFPIGSAAPITEKNRRIVVTTFNSGGTYDPQETVGDPTGTMTPEEAAAPTDAGQASKANEGTTPSQGAGYAGAAVIGALAAVGLGAWFVLRK